MTAADRCQAAAIVTGGLAFASGSVGLWYLTVALLWGAVMHLTSVIREGRRQPRQDQDRLPLGNTSERLKR